MKAIGRRRMEVTYETASTDAALAVIERLATEALESGVQLDIRVRAGEIVACYSCELFVTEERDTPRGHEITIEGIRR